MGRVEDKVAKNILAIRKTPGTEDLPAQAFTGDAGLTLVEPGPYGVIGSITPSTNPTSSVINNSIGMVAAGNAVVFNPHPAAKRCCQRAIEVLNEGIERAGGPANLIVTVAEPTLETSRNLMKHPRIRMLCITGGPAVVRMGMMSGKKCIGAGPGNPPVVVDETADIAKAAKDIVFGASFDNNVMCIAEKEVFAVSEIFEPLKRAMMQNGAYELTSMQAEALCRIAIREGGVGCAEPVLNRDMVGRSAQVLAKAIGLDLPDDIRLLITETAPDHQLVFTEQLMPFLPLVRVRDVNEAIDWSVKAEGGNFHTATMHSRNVANLSRMASLVNTTIFVKNGPCLAGLGYGGEGHTTLTIAGPTGEGITSPRSFTRQRRCVLVDYFRII
jgi:propionaldehyde dehydrogenase